jgi:HTH-type transcriptional regulator / antitoxin HigA
LPSSVSPPGESLSDLLEERGIKQAELATRMDVTSKFINELVAGKVSITPSTAIALEMALDVPADFWLARDAKYQASLARVKAHADFSSQVSWLDEIPIADMRRHKWIGDGLSKTDLVRECLRFFGVSSVDAWREQYLAQTLDSAAYRKSPKVEADRGAVAAWLRFGEILGGKVACAPFNRQKFMSAIDDARSLTVKTDPKSFIPELQAKFAECGVAVIFAPPPKRCPVNGVARWLTSDKALVQLSFRYGTNDSMWFSFFHECGHIALHGKKMLFLESKEMSGAEEDEANRFAADRLIPPASWTAFRPLTYTEDAIRAFAKELGIDPGIVVGRLQTEKILPWQTRLNHIKARCTWSVDE